MDEFTVTNGNGDYKTSYAEGGRLSDGSRPEEITGLIFLLESDRVAAAVWDEHAVYSKEQLLKFARNSEPDPAGQKRENLETGADAKPPGTEVSAEKAPAAETTGSQRAKTPAAEALRAETSEADEYAAESSRPGGSPVGMDPVEFIGKMSGRNLAQAVSVPAQDANIPETAANDNQEAMAAKAPGHTADMSGAGLGSEETEGLEKQEAADGRENAGIAQESPGRQESFPAKWEQIRNSFPIVRPFQFDTGMEYVNIAIKDLTLLDRKYWVLGNNSFLLHNFYNYRYLILGRSLDRDFYQLGVPGIFHEREQMMADMFGFGSFQGSARQDREPGCFGYYIKNVRL